MITSYSDTDVFILFSTYLLAKYAIDPSARPVLLEEKSREPLSITVEKERPANVPNTANLSHPLFSSFFLIRYALL